MVKVPYGLPVRTVPPLETLAEMIPIPLSVPPVRVTVWLELSVPVQSSVPALCR